MIPGYHCFPLSSTNASQSTDRHDICRPRGDHMGRPSDRAGRLLRFRRPRSTNPRSGPRRSRRDGSVVIPSKRRPTGWASRTAWIRSRRRCLEVKCGDWKSPPCSFAVRVACWRMSRCAGSRRKTPKIHCERFTTLQHPASRSSSRVTKHRRSWLPLIMSPGAPAVRPTSSGHHLSLGGMSVSVKTTWGLPRDPDS
jgi:hypothetical protein